MDRHPLFPMWVVRAPGYEIQIHRKFGTSRTLIDGHGQLLWGSEWWGGSGVFEVAFATGAEETAPFAWSHPAKEIRWQGPKMEVTAPSGESFTATFGEHAIRYEFHGQARHRVSCVDPVVFWHATGRLRTAKDQPLASFPPTIGDFHWILPTEPRPFARVAVLGFLTPAATGRVEPSPGQHQCLLAAPRRRALSTGLSAPEDKLPSLADEAIRAT